MRIHLITEGSRGDVQPMVVLGEALARAGHQAIVCGPPESAGLAEGRAVSYRPVGVSIQQRLQAEAEVIARGGSLAFLNLASRFMRETVTEQFHSLEAATRDSDFLIGAGIQLAGPSLAESRGIPYRYVVFCPALLASAEHPATGVPHHGWAPWANRLSWRIMRALYNGLLRRSLCRARARLGLGPVADVYPHLLTHAPLLATDAALAPAPEDCPLGVRPLGFLFDGPGPPLPDKLEAFLAAGEAPVFVGFGSMTDPDPAATTSLIAEAGQQAGCRIVLQRGWAELGQGPLPENVFVTGPVAHGRLLPRVRAAVHHGGAGTTSAAARAGIPQVVIPHGADQYYWAHRAWRAGVSPGSLPRRRLDTDGLAGLLRAALEGESLAERAAGLGEALRAGDAGREELRRKVLD